MRSKQIYLTEDLIEKVQRYADASASAPGVFSAALREILDTHFKQDEQEVARLERLREDLEEAKQS
jgi:hypothetical protein